MSSESPYITPNAMKTFFVYVTARNAGEAARIGRALVEERLAACVNLIPAMHSIYWWEGKIEEDEEALLVAKTTESLIPKVVEKIKSLHSYSCPCVVSWPITAGNPDFLKWIVKETTPREKSR